MVDLTALSAAATSLKTAFEIAKAMAEVKNAVDIQVKVFELQREILSAQQETFKANEAQSALLKQVGDLEAQIARLKEWNTEKQNYRLKSIG